MAYQYIHHKLHLTSGNKTMPIHPFTQGFGQSVYIYDLDDVKLRFEALLKAFAQRPFHAHYAMKANAHPRILQALRTLGAGVDVVSGGELKWALEQGFAGSDVVFSGVAKTETEIRQALAAKVGQINVESPSELKRIAEMAKSMNTQALVAWRMNPDVNPVTHPYIRTGFRENKFGMDESFLPELKEVLRSYSSNLRLQGLTMHIGSQLRDLTATFEAIEKVKKIYLSLLAEGHKLSTFDIGGGLGIDYKSDSVSEDFALIKTYGQKVSEILQDLPAQILAEPGRILVARCGLLLTEVQYIKQTPFKNFAIVSTGMHHLLRPSLYQAYHRILPLDNSPELETKAYDVVGPICESSDVLGFDRMLPNLREGSWLAIADTGAYGQTMSSDYNMQPRAKEIVVENGFVHNPDEGRSH